MDTENSQAEQGLALAANLPEIMLGDANAQIKPIYDDIQCSLRVPFVNLVFRVLANFPDYLVPAWQGLVPIVRSAPFEAAADRLRDCAALDPLPAALEVSVANEDELFGFNDTIHYVLPKLLLIATLLDEGRSSDDCHFSAKSGELPLGIAEGATKIEMLSPTDAPPAVARLFERIKTAHGHPLVSSYFRGLGQWPDLLGTLWATLEPIVGSPAYEQQKEALIASATAEAEALSGAGSIITAPAGSEGDKIRLLLAAFRRKFIPEMLIDAVLIKAMLEGQGAATASPFSVRG